MSGQKNEIHVKGNVLDVFLTFFKLGLTSFGGPIAHIGYFRKTLVEQKGWLSENQFSQLLAICQFLPGPASSQLGFLLGLLRAGWLGALLAFLAFTLPSVLILLLFASALPYLSSEISIAAIHGLKLVACAVVADAVLGMFKNLCSDIRRRLIALMALCTLVFLGGAGMQMWVIFGGAIAGLFLCTNKDNNSTGSVEFDKSIEVNYSKSFGAVLLSVFFLLLMLLPLFAHNGGLYSIAQAFYQAGALVFGGGHVVLPLLETSMVGSGLVSQESFLAGYGASQAIPGPMFSFSAYLGAIISSEYSSLFMGLFTLFFMFLPGFMLVAGVLPFWQVLSKQAKMTSIITGINSAVVGVLAAALYDPIITSGLTSFTDIAIVIIAMFMLIKFKLSPLLIVLWCVLASVLSLWI